VTIDLGFEFELGNGGNRRFLIRMSKEEEDEEWHNSSFDGHFCEVETEERRETGGLMGTEVEMHDGSSVVHICEVEREVGRESWKHMVNEKEEDEEDEEDEEEEDEEDEEARRETGGRIGREEEKQRCETGREAGREAGRHREGNSELLFDGE